MPWTGTGSDDKAGVLPEHGARLIAPAGHTSGLRWPEHADSETRGKRFAITVFGETWLERSHGEGILNMAVQQLRGADIVFAGDRTESRQQQFQLVRFRKTGI